MTVADLRVGLAVEYLGDKPDAVGVLDDHLRAIGMALYSGHPGRIWRANVQHVQVTWVGLEQEPVSYAVGFSSRDLSAQSGYPGLGLLADDTFESRRQVITEMLANGRDLSAWTPPWTGINTSDD